MFVGSVNLPAQVRYLLFQTRDFVALTLGCKLTISHQSWRGLHSPECFLSYWCASA